MKLQPEISEWASSDDQEIEKGSLLLSKWFQPELTLCENHFQCHFDRLRNLTLEHLREKHPRHKIFNLEDFDYKALTDSLCPPEDCMKILRSLVFILANENLIGDSELDLDPSSQRCFLDKVFETKQSRPISLCIIFLCVARRLGVFLEPINFPQRFLLKFKEHPSLSPSQQYTYIDVWAGCRFMDENQLFVWTRDNVDQGISKLERDWIRTTDSREIINRILRNFEASLGGSLNETNLAFYLGILEMRVALRPSDKQNRYQLAMFFFRNEFNQKWAHKILEEGRNYSTQVHAPSPYPAVGTCPFVRQYDQLYENLSGISGGGRQESRVRVKRRSDSKNKSVQFAVGMVMQHRKYHYRCVIYGWDSVCSLSREWQHQMGVGNLERGAKQPFYNVLVEDGSQRYAAEDNLKPVIANSEEPTAQDQHRKISHFLVGKYFERFTGKRYVVNPAQTEKYPEDDDTAKKLSEEIYGKE